MKTTPRSLRTLTIVCASFLTPAAHAATVTWDSNAAAALQTDGGGVWLGTGQWWNGTTNVDWTSGDDAIFGNAAGTGTMNVTLASPTTVGSLSVGFFNGTYTLGTSGQDITLNNGINRFGGQVGTVNISSPLILAGAQTWTNNAIAAAPLNLNAATTLNGDLTFDGDGVINSVATAAAIGGTGNIIKNGTGQFNFSAGGTAPTHTFTGDLVVNGGSIGFQTSGVLTGRNAHLTDGYLGGRYGSGFTWTNGLGTGADQIRITGGTSGLSGEGSVGSTFQIGTAGSTLVWGDASFNPTVLLLNGNHRMNTNGKGALNNAIDLSGATRTITSTQVTDGANSSGFTVSGAITTSSGTAGLNKTGTGNLILTADNTYNGATTIQGDNAYSGSNPYLVTAPGSITLSGANGRISNTSALNLTSGGTLRMVSTNGQNTVDRISSAAITVNGGGLWWENAAGANSFAETVGNVALNSGLFNVNLATNQTAAGDQTLTLGTLTRSGASNASAIAFSAGGTGPQASSNKNMIVVTGAGTTAAGEIVGAWATTGTAPNVQNDYAVYNSDYVTPLGAAANNDETTWTSSDNINFDTATTLTATRTVNTLRYSAAAATLDLGSNNLETTGLLNGGSGLLTLAGTGELTTPTGGGNLYVTTGSNNITAANPITDNGGAVSLVKSGTAAVTLANGNLSSQGALLLNGVNTYTGDTIINGGTLRIGGSNVANGAKLGGAGGNYAGDIQINGGGLLWISSNANQTLSGIISGDGALMKTYSGTLTLSGANTYTGRTSISPSQTSGAGTVEVSSFNSVNGGSPLLASSSLGAPTTVANGTIDLGGPASVQGPAALRYTGSGETTDRVMNIRFGANTSRTIETNGSGLLKFTSPFTFENLGQASVTTINLQGTGNGEIVGGLPSVGGYAVAKSGAGTWTIGGPVGHSGTTTVSAGTLILNGGKPGAGAVAVNGTSTLGGSGTIGGTVTVAAGANLAPGASAGVLNLTGNLNISAPSGGAGKLYYELGPLAGPNDQITVAGTLTIGTLGFGDFDFTNIGGMQNGTYTLITSGTLSGALDGGDLSGAIGAGTGTLQLNGNNVELLVSGLGGGAPEIAVEQPALTDIATGGSKAFGTVTVGSNTSLVFTVRNTGTADLNLSGSPLVAVSGTNAADFTVTAAPSTPVAASGTTTFTVQFAPGAVGARSALLSIANDDSDENPFTINVSGTGSGTPEIAVEQPALTDIASGGLKAFGTVTLGSNTSLVFTVRNTGTADLNLSGSPLVAVSGTNAADFTVTATPSTPVAASGTTTFTVQFAPGGAGSRSALLTIANDDSDENPFTVNVSGTGQTQYAAWSGGAAFGADANGDGVDNGMAFLLGAANPSANALGNLPKASQSAGKLVLDFTCLKVAKRGSAVLALQYSKDLGATDLWSSHVATVPDTSTTVNGVVFTATANANPDLINLKAEIPASAALPGKKIFARLNASNP